MAKSDTGQIGTWAFYIAVIIAVVGGIVPSIGSAPWAAWILLLAGLIVGFLKVSDKNAMTFIIVGIALMASDSIASSLVAVGIIGNYVNGIVGNVVSFIAPAALVVVLKQVWSIKDW